MASKFIKGLFEKTAMLAGDWFVIQPDAEESTAYKIKQSNALVGKLDKSTTEPNRWYLSNDGSDSNVGSANFPFRTRQKAIDTSSNEDTIEILDMYYTDSGNVTVSKILAFVGPIPTGGGTAFPELGGQWTISQHLMFENIAFNGSIISSANKTLEFTNCATDIPSTDNRNLTLILKSCWFDVSTLAGWKIIISKSGTIFHTTSAGGSATLNVGQDIKFYDTTSDENLVDIVTGLDTTSPDNILYNSSIKYNLTVTGDLTKINSVVVGTETVSGTTTDEVQDDVTKLSLTLAADQVVVSNVEFNKKISVGTDGGSFDEESNITGSATESIQLIQTLGGAQKLQAGANTSVGAHFGKRGGKGFGFVTSGEVIPISISASGATTFPDDNTALGRTDIRWGALFVTGFCVANGVATSIQTSEPVDPDDGESVTWTHDGSGVTYGIGDVVTKSTVGITTKAQILLDYSAL